MLLMREDIGETIDRRQGSRKHGVNSAKKQEMSQNEKDQTKKGAGIEIKNAKLSFLI